MEILESNIFLADIHKLCSWATDTMYVISSSHHNPSKPVRLNQFNQTKPIQSD